MDESTCRGNDEGIVMVVEPFKPECQGDEIATNELELDLEVGHQDCGRKIPLYCPLSKQPFIEPVVHPKGFSFEQESIKELDVDIDLVCYPNRALKEYLDPTTDAAGELKASNTEKQGVFCCPVTCDLLRDPVIDPEGNTFERHAIVEWIKKHDGVSPITRNPLTVESLYDNTTLRIVLLQQVQQLDKGAICADVEEWKKEVSKVPRASYPPPLCAQELRQALRSPRLPKPTELVGRESFEPPAAPISSTTTLPQTARDSDEGGQLEQRRKLAVACVATFSFLLLLMGFCYIFVHVKNTVTVA